MGQHELAGLLTLAVEVRSGSVVAAGAHQAEYHCWISRPGLLSRCISESADPLLDRLSITMGYAGVYSSFLKHANRAAERYDVSGAEILMECGRRGLVGGQEDQIIQIASTLAKTG